MSPADAYKLTAEEWSAFVAFRAQEIRRQNRQARKRG
jgi:hypothetical protein